MGRGRQAAGRWKTRVWANNTLIEFDTVSNQMMFLMTEWGVAPANPFYVVLKRVAREAFTHRHA
ncbi:MAG: hypothetical protein ACYDEN_09440 [Acidimicrobiales bacterium]